MDEGLVKIILAVITLLSAIITGVVVPYLKVKREEIKANLTKEQRETISFWTGIAVVAFEKKYENEVKKGTVKKELVMKFVKSFNLDMEEEVLSVLVDAIVEELINNPLAELVGENLE